MVEITKILHGDRNHSIQNKLWPITSFIWCALIRKSLFSPKANGFIFSHPGFLVKRMYFITLAAKKIGG